MNNRIAQAIQLPGPNDTQISIQYPDSYRGFNFTQLGDVISQAVPYVLAFAGFGLLLMILSGGFTMLLSGGDAKKLESGKQTLTYAFTGFLVIFVAFWITQLVGKVLGLNDIRAIFRY